MVRNVSAFQHHECQQCLIVCIYIMCSTTVTQVFHLAAGLGSSRALVEPWTTNRWTRVGGWKQRGLPGSVSSAFTDIPWHWAHLFKSRAGAPRATLSSQSTLHTSAVPADSPKTCTLKCFIDFSSILSPSFPHQTGLLACQSHVPSANIPFRDEPESWSPGTVRPGPHGKTCCGGEYRLISIRVAGMISMGLVDLVA